MKRIILNIPNGYDDVLSVTCIGGAGTKIINVASRAYDITDTGYEKEINIDVDVKDGE